jgi:hypothetical protein
MMLAMVMEETAVQAVMVVQAIQEHLVKAPPEVAVAGFVLRARPNSPVLTPFSLTFYVVCLCQLFSI